VGGTLLACLSSRPGGCGEGGSRIKLTAEEKALFGSRWRPVKDLVKVLTV